jgi:ZIP family zinc transporter
MLAGLATVAGILAVLTFGRLGIKTLAFFLGFASGVMTAVVIFDLIPSALEYGNVLTACTGFLAGLIIMLVLDILISSLSGLKSTGRLSAQSHFLKMGYLIAVGIALHDLPEGIAIAVGYSAKDSLGVLIALAIGLHNIPEGMATAAPLLMGGIARWKIILTGLIISLFTPLGAWLGLMIVAISPNFICLLLALAGGAMAFIVRNELIPEAQRTHPFMAKAGFVIGLIFILLLGMIHQ